MGIQKPTVDGTIWRKDRTNEVGLHRHEFLGIIEHVLGLVHGHEVQQQHGALGDEVRPNFDILAGFPEEHWGSRMKPLALLRFQGIASYVLPAPRAQNGFRVPRKAEAISPPGERPS